MNPLSYLYLGLQIQEPTSLVVLHHHCLQVILVYFTQVYIDLSTREDFYPGFFFCTLLEVWPRLILRLYRFSVLDTIYLTAYFKLYGTLFASSLPAYSVEDTRQKGQEQQRRSPASWWDGVLMIL